MAVMTLEKLIALGCRRVVTWGWCGALALNLRLGDLLVPVSGFSEEGTSQHYRIAAGADEGSRDWRLRIQAHLAAAGFKVTEGAVWTTDAPYRETKVKVEGYAARGALAVEMEFTALAALAAFRRIELAAVLVVSDELWRAPWRPGFQDRDFKGKNRLVLEGLFDWLRKFNGY
jgi:uridine phosphorylase